MAELSDLWRAPRRDVRGMKEQLAALEPGTLVAAKFENPRYGRWIVEGELKRSSAGDFTVAGSPIGSAKAPDGSLLSITVLEEPASVTPSEQVPEHGAVVRAAAFNDGHGRFFLTGTVVEAPVFDGALDGASMVGGWLLGHPGVAGIEVLAAPGEHDQPVPPRITAVDASALEV
ncbi:hypothetical protein [Agromyces seonyuensis]|uniref:hypothetical protein n=1 Tax=Agromyces seonyuensis TaxID=2662446 RepID=UPI0013667071|nr:hypothetical protein [Agromyces seonyuensis]